jgi:hypothetical protein
MISPTTRPTSDEVRLSRLVLQHACHEPLRGRQPGVDLRARMGTDEWVAVDADVGEASFERLDELCRPRERRRAGPPARHGREAARRSALRVAGWLNVRTAVTEGDS